MLHDVVGHILLFFRLLIIGFILKTLLSYFLMGFLHLELLLKLFKDILFIPDD